VLSLLSGCGGGSQVPPTIEVDEATLQSYAEAIWNIEQQRDATYTRLLETLPQQEIELLEQVRCNEPESIRGLSRRGRREVVDYCEAVAETIARYNFSVTGFNTIDARVRQDPQLEERAIQQLVQLRSQQPAPPPTDNSQRSPG
jgi:hypothetical protein